MIPVSLNISGFLSYQQPAEIDFTDFDRAVSTERMDQAKCLFWIQSSILFPTVQKKSGPIIYDGIGISK